MFNFCTMSPASQGQSQGDHASHAGDRHLPRNPRLQEPDLHTFTSLRRCNNDGRRRPPGIHRCHLRWVGFWVSQSARLCSSLGSRRTSPGSLRLQHQSVLFATCTSGQRFRVLCQLVEVWGKSGTTYWVFTPRLRLYSLCQRMNNP